jgi:HAD superfamily hydrolase (TIGR01509 family)
MTEAIKAVLFDMDGVLIEAKEWHYESLNRALALFGFEISRYDHLVTYDGLPTRRKLEMLSRERGLPTGLHGLVNDLKQKYTMEIVHSKCRPTFHHQYALSKLKARGLRLAVCSNSIRQTVDQMLSRAGIHHWFDLTLSNEDVAKAKPDPEIYSSAMARLGLLPSQCIVVEDNQNGIRAATAAGAHVLAVENTDDVTYENIAAKIAEVEANHA